MRRIALVFATVVGVLVLAPLALGATKPESVTITITNKLTETGTAHPGSITFHVVNKGKVARAFSIDGKTIAVVKPGKTGSLVVTLKKGSYPYTSTATGKAKLTGNLQVSA
jgi:hypothetical protein